MKYIACLLVGTLMSAYTAAEAADAKVVVSPVQPAQRILFPLTDVRLGDSQFKEIQELDHAYLLSLEPERLFSAGRPVLRLRHLLILSGSRRMFGVGDLWLGTLWAFPCLPCR